MAESPIDILSSAADSQRVYYLANTISEFYSPAQKAKDSGIYSVKSQTNTYCYSYDESLSLHTNGQKELTFKLNDQIIYQDQLIRNPFTISIVVGSQLLLTDKNHQQYLFTVKSINTSFEKNNLVYEYSCQDSFSYQLSRQNSGYTINNDSSSETFIGAKSVDWWIEKICKECNVHYVYLPLQLGLYQDKNGAIHTYSAPVKDLDTVIKPYYKQIDYPDFFTQFPFSISGSTANAAIIAAAETVGLQVQTYEKVYSDADDHLYILRYFWLKPLKDNVRGITGCKYSPNRDVQDFSLSFSGDNLSSILNIQSRTRDNKELVSLLPTVSPFFASLFGTAYWKNSKYSAGRFNTLCHGFYLTANYQYKNNRLIPGPGATDILANCIITIPTTGENATTTFVFDTKSSSTLLDIWQLYDKVNFNQGGLYCILNTKDKKYRSNWTRWNWVLLEIVKDKNGNIIKDEHGNNTFALLQTLTEQDDIPWYRLNSTDDTHEYRFGITVDGWTNSTTDPLESLELHIYVGRTASSSDLEFAQIADKCPWLENKLRSFDYFQKIGLISKSQLKKVNNIISNDLRKVNGELLLYANDYYQALHKRTETVANLLAQFDSLGAAAESDIITPYSTDGKITFPTNYFDAAYGSIFTPTFNKTAKTQLTAYDDLITNYSNLYFNAQQRFLKNLYQFRNYFNSPTTRYSGKNQNSFGLVHISRSADEPPLTNGETANWIRFKTGTTFSPATADNVSWDNNETPQQIWYSAGDSSGNHSTLTVVDKSNVGKYYQLSDIQRGKQQISDTDNAVYSKDNSYWAFVQYDPNGTEDETDDAIHLNAQNKIDLWNVDAATSNKNIRRIDLQLRPQLDKKRRTVSLGDLWNLRHLNEIYQRDTINVYSPISVITKHAATNWDGKNYYEADWTGTPNEQKENYFIDYFSFKIFKGYDKLNGIDPDKDDPSDDDWIDAYFNNLPISNLYYQVINKDGSKTYKPLSWLNADTYKNYYKYIKNDNAVIGESIAAGEATAGGVAGLTSAAVATAMAGVSVIPVAGWIAVSGMLIAGIVLACVAGLANKSFLDTTGDCNIDLDKQKLTVSATAYVPHAFQNCIPCITDKTKINDMDTTDAYTYDKQLQYLPINFVNYVSLTAKNTSTNRPIWEKVNAQSEQFYFKNSWAERLNNNSTVNTTDTYYLLPICSNLPNSDNSDASIMAFTLGFSQKVLNENNSKSDLLSKSSYIYIKNNPFFQQTVVSTVLNYPIFNRATEIHFSKQGKLIDLLEKDYDSLDYNDDINAFCGVKTLSGIDPKTGETHYLKLSNGAATTASEAEATKVAQVFVVYRKRDYVPIKAGSKTYWDAFKSGYSFYSTIDDSPINYSTKPDLLVGCYRQETNANDNSITAEWDDKGATAYWERITDDNNKVSYRPIYTARQLLHYKDALAAPIRALVKTDTSYEQTVLFDDGARLHIPIVYCSLTKATNGSRTQKLLPQQDTLDLEVSNIGGKYYLYEVGKPKLTEEDNNLVLTVSRTIHDQTYTATFDLEWDDTESNYLQDIGQMTNGAFWLKYHTLPTNADEAAALQPLFDYAAAIETQLESYWTVAYAASKYCDYFLPEHWQPYTEKEANYFSDKIIATMGNNAVISDLYVPNISVCEHAEQKDYSLTYYSNPDDRKNPSTDNEDISKWIIDDDGETSGGIADMSTIVNNNEAYSNRRDFINTVSNGGSNYFYDHYTINQTAIDKQKKYYYASSGGCRWSELVNRLSGRKDLSYDHYSGIYPRLINVLLRQYQNNPCYTYTRLKQQHDLIWQRLYQNYPNLMLENTYSNNDATTSLELYQFAKQYFNKYCQPERNYNISTIDVAQLRGYEGDATVLHVGDAIELDPNEYVDTKAADDPVYSALNQYLFISDISYKLRSDADIQLTVNDIKYEDKLIKSLATLIR